MQNKKYRDEKMNSPGNIRMTDKRIYLRKSETEVPTQPGPRAYGPDLLSAASRRRRRRRRRRRLTYSQLLPS